MNTSKNAEHECAICSGKFTGWGNNPAPFPGDRCCEDCNARFVIPARMTLRRLTDEELALLRYFAMTGRAFATREVVAL